MSKDSVKTQIDIDITNKISAKSISPLNVGGNMKDVVDLIPDNIIKTIGSVIAVSGSKAILQYDINTVNKDGGSEVKLPTTTEIGKEILFLASNYTGTVSVYVNDAKDIKLSGGTNGISGNQGNLQINANEAYRFIYRTNDYWYFEKIIDIPNNYYQLVSERSTDGTLASNSNFKYPTEQAVKTYVDNKDSRPYKVYTAILTQTSTNNPTATVLENTLGGTITWVRYLDGRYRADLSYAGYILNKTIGFATPGSHSFAASNQTIKVFVGSNASELIVYTTENGVLTDGILHKVPIEIRVYN